MITLFEVIKHSEAYLNQKGLPRSRREAEELIADILGLKRLDLYLQFDRPLVQNELSLIKKAVQRRGTHEPAAHIRGSVEFAGLSLKVTQDVLIPRPETEILVEKIASKLCTLSLENRVLWDICCGSGCIGLALKKRFPSLEVVLSDLSAPALEVARQNAQVEVCFKQGDLFEPFKGQSCDFFVCNPPYVSENEYADLTEDVRLWEPKSALVPGKTGLEFYARLARELEQYLRPNGLGWLELGAGQRSEIKKIFESEGWTCSFESDWSGHDRFFFIEKF